MNFEKNLQNFNFFLNILKIEKTFATPTTTWTIRKSAFLVEFCSVLLAAFLGVVSSGALRAQSAGRFAARCRKKRFLKKLHSKLLSCDLSSNRKHFRRGKRGVDAQVGRRCTGGEGSGHFEAVSFPPSPITRCLFRKQI